MVRKTWRVIEFANPFDGEIGEMLVDKINAQYNFPVDQPFEVGEIDFPSSSSVSFAQCPVVSSLVGRAVQFADGPGISELATQSAGCIGVPQHIHAGLLVVDVKLSLIHI